MKKIPLFLVLALGILLPQAHALMFVGELTSASSPEGVETTGGSWGGSTGFKIKWQIEEIADDVWSYIYTITSANDKKLGTWGAKGAVSHFIIEISPEATGADFWNFEVDGCDTDKILIDDYSGSSHGGSNPNMPGVMHGLKMDISKGKVYSFYSSKAPVWGDFYAKDGVAGKKSKGPATLADMNAAWNADFLDPDPDAPAQSGLLSDGNGGYLYKLLRPDTTSDTAPPTPAVPEPSTLLLMALGLPAAALARRRFGTRKK